MCDLASSTRGKGLTFGCEQSGWGMEDHASHRLRHQAFSICYVTQCNVQVCEMSTLEAVQMNRIKQEDEIWQIVRQSWDQA